MEKEFAKWLFPGMKKLIGNQSRCWKKRKGEKEDLVIQAHPNILRTVFLAGIVLFFVSGHSLAQNALQPEKKGMDAEMKYDYSFSEGLKYKMLGNPTEASSHFSLCTSLLPERPTPYYELALIDFRSEKFPEAEGYIQTAIQIDPDNKWYQLLYIQVLIALQRKIEAADAYFSVYQSFPEQTEFLVAGIDLLIAGGESKQALKKLSELEQVDGYAAEAAMRQKDMYLALGKEKRAIKILEALADDFPDQAEYRGVLAELLAEKGYDERAMEEYLKIKESNPDNPVVYFSLGQFYMAKGQRNKAVQEFETGFRSKQVNPEIKLNLILELLKEQSADSLTPDMSNLLDALYETDNGHPAIDALYANYLFDSGRVEQAEDIYRRVVVSDPGNFAVWQRLLFIQNDQLDFDEMYDYAKRAVTAFPNQSLFYLFYGMSCNVLEKYEEAVPVLRKGKRLNSGNSDLTKQYYISLGDALYHTGNHEEAFKNFDLLLVLDSDNIVVLNNYAYYLSQLEQELDKAVDMIQKTLVAEPDNPTYLDTYAWVLFKMGEFQQALEVMEQVIQMDEADLSGEVMEHYGDILYRNKRKEAAVSAWKKAKKLSGAGPLIDKKINQGSLDVQ